MSFEDILRQWEENERRADGEAQRRRRQRLESLLDRYPPDPAEKGEEDPIPETHGRPSPAALPIEDEIDLHGMTVEEAVAATARFIETGLAAGYRKVLIVHGKGLHSQNGGVLGAAVRRFIEKHPDTGAMGTPKRRDGGSGALWVVLRHRSR
ncbi:MAG: Smr/MutS family protein [Spirochaetota bacterium]